MLKNGWKNGNLNTKSAWAGAKCDHLKLEVCTRVRALLNLDMRGAHVRPKKRLQPILCKFTIFFEYSEIIGSFHKTEWQNIKALRYSIRSAHSRANLRLKNKKLPLYSSSEPLPSTPSPGADILTLLPDRLPLLKRNNSGCNMFFWLKLNVPDCKKIYICGCT